MSDHECTWLESRTSSDQSGPRHCACGSTTVSNKEVNATSNHLWSDSLLGHVGTLTPTINLFRKFLAVTNDCWLLRGAAKCVQLMNIWWTEQNVETGNIQMLRFPGQPRDPLFVRCQAFAELFASLGIPKTYLYRSKRKINTSSKSLTRTHMDQRLMLHVLSYKCTLQCSTKCAHMLSTSALRSYNT